MKPKTTTRYLVEIRTTHREWSDYTEHRSAAAAQRRIAKEKKRDKFCGHDQFLYRIIEETVTRREVK